MKDGWMKFVEVLVRRQDITDERFHYYWRAVHGPIAGSMPGLDHYIQLHRIAPALPGLPRIEGEGIVEAWFEEKAVLDTLMAHPSFLERTQPDEQNFLAPDGLTAFLTSERTIVAAEPGRPAGSKAVLLLKRRAGLTPEEFRQRWPEFADSFAAAAMPRHFTVALVDDEEYEEGEPTYDGFGFLTWDDVLALERAWDSDPLRERLAELGEVAALTRSGGFVAEEVRICWDPEV